MSSNSKAPKAKAQRPFLKSKVHPIVKVVEETYQGPAPESLDLAVRVFPHLCHLTHYSNR